jgi:hypothetical protein
MALCPSGAMSLGGSDAPRSVACELGLDGTTQICMDQAAVRTLAGRAGAGTAICMCDFYGKSSFPALGGPLCGGYYFGAVSSPANYYIIIAPNATGCACCQWKTTMGSSASTGSCTDGYANTYNGLAATIHPAGNWTATRSIGGFSDWYLPARDELNLVYTNRNSAPSGEGFAAGIYWSSTEYTCQSACIQNFADGCLGFNFKFSDNRVRAVRRQAF